MEDIENTKVLEIISSEEDLISSIDKYPDVDGIIVTSDLAKVANDSRLDLFVDVLFHLRKTYPKLNITVLSNEKIGHPALAELYEMSIYNIFVKGVDDFTTENLLNSLQNPSSIADAMKFREVDPSIPWRRSFQKKHTLSVEINGSREIASTETQTTESSESNKKRAKKKPNSEDNNYELAFDDDLFEDTFISGKSIIHERKIGTVTIAVTSSGHNVGSTHNSIIIASYLKRKGFTVALIEGNRTGDFIRLQEIYSDEGVNLNAHFDVKDITHYKYDEKINIFSILPKYDYVIFDLGPYKESPWINEFARAQKRIFVANHSDWKLKEIGEFINLYSELPFEILLPFGDLGLINDLQEIYGSDNIYYDMPFHRHAYDKEEETDEVIDVLIGEIVPKQVISGWQPNVILWTSLISILVTIVVISSLVWFMDY